MYAGLGLVTEQSCALAALVHRGQLTDEHRYLIAKLLDEIGTSVRVAAEVAQRYPDDPAAQDLARALWEPVGTGYARLLDAVSPVAARWPLLGTERPRLG